MSLSSAGLPAGPLIAVRARSTALVFSTDAGKHLTQSYVGLESGVPGISDSVKDNDNVVYPAAGGVFHSQPALRVTHFDGNTSTDLIYLQHLTQDLDPGVTLTTIKLKDSYYPFFVELCIKSHSSDDVFEEWVRVHHQEPAAVTLYEVASAGLVVNAPSYSLRHFSRDQHNRLIPSDTKLTPLLEFSMSVGGTTASRVTEPVFVVSLEEDGAQSNKGAALGGALLTAGDFVNSFEYEEPDEVSPGHSTSVKTRLRILGNTNPRSIPRTILPDRTLVTEPMVFTYQDQGAQAVVDRLRAWGRSEENKHRAGVKALLDLPPKG